MIRLSELVSRLGSPTFPIVSMAIFLTVFVAVTIHTLRRSARDEQDRANRLPLEDEHEWTLTGHEYDGIQEYDNPLPGWWTGIFIVTILFAPIYVWWYHLGGPGHSIHRQFDEDWKGYVAWKAAADQDAEVVVTEDLLTSWAHDPGVVANGRAIFTKNCVGCHMDDGRGNIGPNLTDAFQIHGSQRLHLFETIRDGVPDRGMIWWGQSMQPREVAQVAAYVSTLRGHPVDGGKEPQGDKVEALP